MAGLLRSTHIRHNRLARPAGRCVHAGYALTIVVLLALAMDPGVASAQPIIGRARWCMTLPLGGMMQCSYHSLEQCMTYASGVSNQCSLNPWYEGPPEPRRRKRERGVR